MTTPTNACPSCQGRWMYALTFDHTNTCPLRALDDGTHAADLERLAWRSPFTRPATTTEITLAAALGRDPQHDTEPGATVLTIVTATTTSVHRRLLQRMTGATIADTFDPDATPSAA